MKTQRVYTLPLILLAINIIPLSLAVATSSTHNFLECLPQKFKNYSSISNNIHSPLNSSYLPILQYSIHNLRFASESTPKPLVIITPEHESQIPPVIHCAKGTGLQIRTRSGGHDFEGLSYISRVPFVIIDLINLTEIKINVAEKTAWVGGGATIGELYYKIAQKTPVLGFPAGICPSVGVGGHFSGGGYGTMHRKYGLSADNVIDARVIDANGRILDRKSMGEDLFWAIRGGGGASFGVIVAWKVRLVDVPETITVFKVNRTLEQNATRIIHRWQYVAPEINKDLFIGIMLTRTNSSINACFYSLFLGGIDRLLALMRESFPELGLEREDCIETSWVQSVVFIAGYPVESSPRVLLNRTQNTFSFKGKSNYVQEPVPESGLEALWRHLFEDGGESMLFLMNAYGGRMVEISDSAIPYPHRAGNLYKMLQVVSWEEDKSRDSEKYLKWSRRIDDYLTPYVSKNPRERYVNYRDLDLGVNNVEGETSYEEASVWGKKYFKNNFDRLVRVKTMVDPENFFKNEQSIPPARSMLANGDMI